MRDQSGKHKHEKKHRGMGTLKAGGENRVDFGEKSFFAWFKGFQCNKSELFIRLRQVNQ